MACNYCDDCVYRGTLVNGTLPYCKFFLVTNQRRPCPPGEGCTVKVGRKVYRRKGRKNEVRV